MFLVERDDPGVAVEPVRAYATADTVSFVHEVRAATSGAPRRRTAHGSLTGHQPPVSWLIRLRRSAALAAGTPRPWPRAAAA